MSVTTEAIDSELDTIHFNRGSVATQEYARRFQNKPPSGVRPERLRLALPRASRGDDYLYPES